MELISEVIEVKSMDLMAAELVLTSAVKELMSILTFYKEESKLDV